MSAFTLERKLEAPVTCQKCEWLGRAGQLHSEKWFPANTAGKFLCPRCSSPDLKWIESPAPEMIQ